MSVLEEAAYVGLSLIYGCHGFKLRDQLKKELNETARVFLERLKSFITEFRIYHEIKRIATFDHDFNRVDFLEVVGSS